MTPCDLWGQNQSSYILPGPYRSMHIKNAFLGGDVKKWYEKNLHLVILQAKTARKDGRGGLENGDMIFFLSESYSLP